MVKKRTVRKSKKNNNSAYFEYKSILGSSNNFAANNRYPESGSNTCCQGRVDFGLRKRIGDPSSIARMQSGIIRSNAQSPPPITLPARVDAAPSNGFFSKKDRL